MTDNQKKAIEELNLNLEKTKHNFYPKVKLVNLTGITDKELYDLHNKGIITKVRGVNQSLIVLKYE